MKVEYIDHMGDDLSVVNAARVSFAKYKDEYDDRDAKLINYLAEHGHWTPFAHTAITLRVKAPVPIRTQCFKHKVGFTENEESRRYIHYTPEVLWPDYWRKAPEHGVKQGSSPFPVDDPDLVSHIYEASTRFALSAYEAMLNAGVCPEQARFVLPQGVMVNWIWTGNLAAYARFYNLRTDPHAQREVRDLAEQVGQIIAPLFPDSWRALTERTGWDKD